MRLNFPHVMIALDVMIALALCSVILLVPLAVGFGAMGPKMMFDMLAADSMYYMAIANNFVKYGMLTFDGMESTNGFHPLWQWMLALGFKWSGLSHHNQIFLTMGASILFVWLAYVIVSCGLLAMLGTGPGLVASMAMFPGVYSLGFEPRRHYFDQPGVLYTLSPYSAMNGMETPLSLLLWAVFFVAFVPRFFRLHARADARLKEYFPLSVRLCLPLLILCRLDDCFIMIAIAAFVLLWRGVELREKVEALVYACWPTAAVLIAYVGFNYWNYGVLIPTSASAKVDVGNNANFTGFYHVFSVLLTNPRWWTMAVRAVAVLTAMGVGMCGVVLVLRSSKGWRRSAAAELVLLFCLFLVVKALFIVISLNLWSQGYWYYFSMVGIINVMAAMFAGAMVRRYKESLAPAVAMFVLLIMFRMPNDINMLTASKDYSLYFVDTGMNTTVDLHYSLWENSDEIREYLLAKVPGGKLIDTYDGVCAYLLDMPAESYSGLPSSPQELERRRHMGQWQSMLSRGFNIVAGGGYEPLSKVPRDIVNIREILHPPGTKVWFAWIELVNE